MVNSQYEQVTAAAWGRWNNFKNLVCESIERFVPHKIPRKNSDPEYCDKEIKGLKSKIRKAYRGNETTFQAVTCSQEFAQNILKISVQERGQILV
jgi:hypothetical protein